jgi:hypothetical protein
MNARVGGALQVMRTINLKKCTVLIAGINILVLSALMFVTEVHAEGRTYQGSESKAHCNLWDELRLKWPQTSLGREKRECRRKALAPTKTMRVQCRLIDNYIDLELDERMCVFERGATGQGPMTTSMDKNLKCPREIMCLQEK